MKIWQKHFLKEFLQIFFLFLFGIYTLFILIDYSSRSGTFLFKQLSFSELAAFYGAVFFERLDILLPFALLIAIIKTLTSLNLRNELVSLLSSGTPLHTLMRPFIIVGLLCTALLYVNGEFFFPLAQQQIHFLKHLHEGDKPHNDQVKNIYALEVLEEGTLLYHRYDSISDAFRDVFWLREDSLVKMGALSPKNGEAKGFYVETFARPNDTHLTLLESVEEKTFPQMRFNPIHLKQSTMIPREERLSTLLYQLPEALSTQKSDAASALLTSVFHRLFMPWLCLLAIIGPAPWCLRFTRSLPVFMIYMVGIATLVSFYLVMNAALILGESEVFSPFLAISVPFSCYALFFSAKYLDSVVK